MNIICDKCGNEINLDQSLRDSILTEELEKQHTKLEAEYEQKMAEKDSQQQKALDKHALGLQKDFEQEIKLLRDKNIKIKSQELKLKKENMDLEDKAKEAALKAKEKSRAELEKKKAELETENKKYKSEIKSELEEKSSENEKKIKESMAGDLKEKELEIERLRKEAEDARSKLDHAKNPQELVGEAAEILLLEQLQKSFPKHNFIEIKRGTRGADILQEVISYSGEKAGLIYYESKKTKNWQEPWIAKFKEDIRNKGAHIGVLVTKTLPKYCQQDFIYKDGIWITSPRYAHQLAVAMCNHISAVYQAKSTKEAQSSLEGSVYNYITGEQFVEKVKVIAEAHQALNDNLEKEKLAMGRIWSARKIQIDRSFSSVAQIIGDLEGLSDGNIKAIEEFQLKLT